MRLALTIVASFGVLLLAGCGGDDTATPATTETTPTVTEPVETETEPVETMPTVIETETTPKPPTLRQITIVVTDGKVHGGIKRPKLEKGEKVVIVVRSNVGEGVHLHGYDVEKTFVNGKLRLPLTATIPGRFELELHHPDVPIAEIEVTP